MFKTYDINYNDFLLFVLFRKIDFDLDPEPEKSDPDPDKIFSDPKHYKK